MRALITGATGFIGTALLNRLRLVDKFTTIVGTSKSFGDPIYKIGVVEKSKDALIKLDITRDIDVAILLTTYKPDVIFHYAANPMVKFNDNRPFDLVDVNIRGTQNLLEYAAPDSRFIFASSASVYKPYLKYLEESDRTEPASFYGMSKLAGEKLVEHYSDAKRVRGISLRYVAQVGKNSTHGVFHDIAKKIKSDSKELELFGDIPGSEKPFIHVDDSADAAIHFALRKYEKYDVFNIAACDSVTVYDMAKWMMRTMQVEKPIKWLGKDSLFKGDVTRLFINSQKMNWYNFSLKYYNSYLAIEQATKEII